MIPEQASTRTIRSRGTLRLLGALVLAALLFPSAARAQDPGASTKKAFRYDSQGKRDPFISLRTMQKEEEPAGPADVPPLNRRPPGLNGLLVDEVVVVGTVTGPESRIALLRGVDRFTYFARTGTRLFNGHIESISESSVTFIQVVVDTRGKRHISRITKELYSEQVQVEEKAVEDDEKP